MAILYKIFLVTHQGIPYFFSWKKHLRTDRICRQTQLHTCDRQMTPRQLDPNVAFNSFDYLQFPRQYIFWLIITHNKNMPPFNQRPFPPLFDEDWQTLVVLSQPSLQSVTTFTETFLF